MLSDIHEYKNVTKNRLILSMVVTASVMVIENAERLGLAQLHQLRGRVGRGQKQSACVLIYSPPLSERGKQRLSVLRETNSGFVIAASP